MRNAFKKQKNFFLLMLLMLVGTFLHFYNLNWGAPYYFHPDERNIASAVSQLQFPTQMNPHFFAYGSLPIYAIYFIAVGVNYVSQLLQFTSPSPIATITFEQAILMSRIFSAFFATALIPLLYIITKKLTIKQSHTGKNSAEKVGLLAAFFATVSVGFIQFAHFGTFELWLTFFGVVLFWECLQYLMKPTLISLSLMAVTVGILIAVKVSSLALLPIPLAVIAAQHFRKTLHRRDSGKSIFQLFRKSYMLVFLSFLKNILLFFAISVIVYFVTNPYVILDQKDFYSSMNYESSVALGIEPVFYTGIFFDTAPGLYQFLHVYPFLLNPLLLILFIPSFIFLLWQMIRTKNSPYLLLVTFYLFFFFSQAILFVKWTRYMVPTLPFIYLIIAVSFNSVTMQQFNNKFSQKSVSSFLLHLTIIVSIIFAFSYFKTAFLDMDSRIAAALFAQHAIPVDGMILAETSDLGILPFQDAFPHLTTFNFYELDNNSPDATVAQLQQKVADAQFIILPSQRVLQPRLHAPHRFPKAYIFYKSLFNGSLGFHKIYQTPCDIFCEITYLGDPIYWWEQTVAVFDRPTVFIFKKNG